MIKDISSKILDVKIDKITTKEVLEKIKGFLLSDKQHYIITLNPEMVIESQKNNYFKKIINGADLVTPDGIGILLSYKYIYKDTLPEKITGIDLMHKIFNSDFIKNYKIFLLGAREGIAKKTSRVLLEKYNYLNIMGAEEGIRINQESEIKNQELIQRINKAQPDILFVAFGAPKQEIWIFENLKKIPSVKLAIGVGGSFDFISEKIKRAPFVMQRLGLEWLWRLFLQPKRIVRIYNATIKFVWLILKNKKR